MTANTSDLIAEARTPHCKDCDHFMCAMADALEASEARARASESALRDYDANFPCDGGCGYDGPEETCSRHGRSPADLWSIAEEQIKRANDAGARLREAEALIYELEKGLDRFSAVAFRAEARELLSRHRPTTSKGDL